MRTQCRHGVTVSLHDYRHTYDKKKINFFSQTTTKNDYDRKGEKLNSYISLTN